MPKERNELQTILSPSAIKREIFVGFTVNVLTELLKITEQRKWKLFTNYSEMNVLVNESQICASHTVFFCPKRKKFKIILLYCCEWRTVNQISKQSTELFGHTLMVLISFCMA